jgi:hypothetical protein
VGPGDNASAVVYLLSCIRLGLLRRSSPAGYQTRTLADGLPSGLRAWIGNRFEYCRAALERLRSKEKWIINPIYWYRCLTIDMRPIAFGAAQLQRSAAWLVCRGSTKIYRIYQTRTTCWVFPSQRKCSIRSGVLLGPVLASVAMTFSSVSVISNALRLNNYSYKVIVRRRTRAFGRSHSPESSPKIVVLNKKLRFAR